ncbi:MAG: TFIIB-type zinc ribbon-containing protein [Candidatus Aenigmarchaeota archaeon]|nr:TFIIB-type zinc ribbon-containing protein [Candidatus Aenigmarchaeota archaeon]
MIHDISKCPDCNSKSIYFDYENYEVLCRKCGLVITDSLPNYSENKPLTKIYLNESSNKIRIAYPHSLESKKERALKEALEILNLVSSQMGFSDLLRKASMDIYIKLYNEGKTMGRNKKILLCACSLIASRTIGYPLLLSDFKKVNLGEKQVINYAKNIADATDIKIKPALPETFAERYAVQLKLPNLTIAVIMKLIEKGKELGVFSSSMFNTVAGACILAGCRITKHPIDYSEVSRLTGMSQGAIIELTKEVLWSVDEKEYEKYINELKL